MFSQLLATLIHDSILLGFVVFVAFFLVYLLVMKMHVYGYGQRHEKKPVHYKIFRLYSKSLITNAPSKSEKKFYSKTNRITYFFNTLLISIFVIFLFVCLRYHFQNSPDTEISHSRQHG